MTDRSQREAASGAGPRSPRTEAPAPPTKRRTGRTGPDAEILTVAEIERRYPDEWVLLEITRDNKHHERKAGRLVAHGADREALDEPYRRFRAEHPRTLLSQFYTGDLVAEGFVAIL